jgi:PHD/YefM family antitoxin component YafN of YafNO toxin-antitoxin module
LGGTKVQQSEYAMETTKVGMREFRAGLAEYIASDTPVAITRHGQTVGYFIPAQGQADADLASLKKAAAELDRLLAAKSVDVEEVAAEFKAARKQGAARQRKPAARTKAA